MPFSQLFSSLVKRLISSWDILFYKYFGAIKFDWSLLENTAGRVSVRHHRLREVRTTHQAPSGWTVIILDLYHHLRPPDEQSLMVRLLSAWP